MLIELTAKLDGVTKMVRELTAVEAATAKADAALRKAEKRVTVFGKAMGWASDKVRGFARDTMSHFVALASFEGLKSLIGHVSHLASEALNAAGEAQRLEKSYELLLGKEPAAELNEWLEKVAKNSEFVGGQVKDLGNDLLTAGFRGMAFKKALVASLDIAAVARSGFSGAQTAIAAFRTVMQKEGVLSEKQLAALQIAPTTLYATMAKAMHTSAAAAEKSFKAGKLEADFVLSSMYAALQKGQGGPLGSRAVQMSTLFGAQWNKTKDIVPNLFEGLSQSPGLQKLADALGKIVEAFDPASPNGQRIINGLDKLLTKVADLVGRIDVDKVAEKLTRLFEALPAMIEGAARAAGMFAEALVKGAEAWSAFTGKEAPGQKAGGALAGGARASGGFLRQLEGELQRLLGVREQSVGGAVSAILTVGHLTDRLGLTGRQGAAGLAQGLQAGVPRIEAAAAAMAGGAATAVQDKLQIRSPSRVFADFGWYSSEGFAMGIEAAIPDVQGTIADAFALPSLVADVPPMPAIGAPDLGAGMAASIPGIGAGGGITVEAPITINIGGGVENEAAAKGLAERVEIGVRAALQSVLEQMQTEVGAT